LFAGRQGRAEYDDLPPELSPQNTTDVQRIIDAVSARIDDPVRGWKTYFLYKPMYPPFCAPVYEVFESGAVIPATLTRSRLTEPEIMFRIDRDLPARDRNYDPCEILDSVTAVLAFEILRSSFRGGSSADVSMYAALSDHISNACVVIGDEVPAWRDIAFEEVRLRMFEDDEELISVVGGHAFENPVLPVVVGVNRLRRRNVDIKAGDIMVTSSCTSFFHVGTRSVVRAAWEELGEVTVTFGAEPTNEGTE
jgi:2-keto-4-pentenoate hydratase